MAHTILNANGGSLLLIGTMAAAISAGLIFALLPILQRRALAKPNARSSHRIPTPQGGGIAVVAATILVAAAATVFLSPPGFGLASLAQVLAATVLLALVGGVDDFRTIGVTPRLTMQAVAVLIILAALPNEMRIVPTLPWWIERTLMFFGGLWFVNLFNFMDGIDWMTVVEVASITGGLTLLGVLGALPFYAVIISLALGGAVAGFAPFNRPVARLFLGDVGSLPVGLLLCWLLMVLAGEGHLAAAALLPLFYLADATLTLFRRIRNGERFWEAHRTHFYQRAIDNGFNALEVVARVLAVNLCLIGLAIATIVVPGPISASASLAVGGTLVGWLLFNFARSGRSPGNGENHRLHPRNDQI